MRTAAEIEAVWPKSQDEGLSAKTATNLAVACISRRSEFEILGHTCAARWRGAGS